MYEKIPPQNIEAEQKLLGGVLFNDANFDEILLLVSAEDFYLESHRIIFNVFEELFNKKQSISSDTVIERLRERKQLGVVGGISFLAKMANFFEPISSRLIFHAKIVSNKAIMRKLRLFAANLDFKVSEADIDDTDKVLAGAQQEVEKITDCYLKKNLSSLVKAEDIDNNLSKEIEFFKNKDFLGYKTGLPTLDKMTDGIIIPHIWIIGGYTGTGKTFCTLTILNGLLKNGARPILFSTENSSTRNLLRMVGCRTGLSEMLLLRGKIDNELMLDRIARVRKEIKNSPLIFYDSVFDTSKMKNLIARHKKEDRSNIVIVDYIQNLNLREGDLYKRMSGVASDLQAMSKELKVAVIGVSQISNAEAMKDNDDLISFKGAGEITAIADVAIWLRRGKERKDLLYALVKKVRHGLGGDIKLDFFTENNMKNEFCYIKEAEKDEQSWK